MQRRVCEVLAALAQGLLGIVVSKLSGSWGPGGGRGWLDLPGVAWGRAASPSRTRREARTGLFLLDGASRSGSSSHHLARGDGSAAPCPPYNPHGLPPAAATQDTAGISAGESDHACLGVLAFCSAPTTPVHLLGSGLSVPNFSLHSPSSPSLISGSKPYVAHSPSPHIHLPLPVLSLLCPHPHPASLLHPCLSAQPSFVSFCPSVVSGHCLSICPLFLHPIHSSDHCFPFKDISVLALTQSLCPPISHTLINYTLVHSS